MKRVLVVGAGRVAKPLVETLLEHPELHLTVAAPDVERARVLVAPGAKVGRGRAVELDVADEEELGRRVAEADAVVSLLPMPLHPAVATRCIEHRVPLVTTSYVSEAMEALDPAAMERGVLLLNECGVDPGVDHMMAVQGIRRIRRAGGRVRSLISWCGGLPAPEAADNPFGYKLSWSPRAVLLATRSPVRFLRGGRVVEHPTPYLPEGPRRVEVPGVGPLEGLPNRDSLPYGPLYGIDEPEDLLRGTLRYPGWAETMAALHRLGLLEPQTKAGLGPSYCDLLDQSLPPGSGPMPSRIARVLDVPEDHPLFERLAWLGLFSQLPLPDEARSPLDATAELFAEKLRYQEGERDMVVLEHHLGVEEANGARREVVERLVVYGTAGDESAMARTVGVPAALVTGLVLDGRATGAGVRIPVDEGVATAVLAGLAERGMVVEHGGRQPDRD